MNTFDNSSINNDNNSELSDDHQFESRLEISNDSTAVEKLDEEFSGEDFQKLVRVGFIRKVYGVLIVQLILTLMLSSIGLNDIISSTYKHNTYLIWVFVGLVVLILTVITCFKKPSKKVPLNYILLLLFTIIMSFIVSYIYILTDNWKLIMSIGGNLILVIKSLIMVTYISKKSYSYIKAFISIISICAVYSVLLLISGVYQATYYYGILGILVYSVYLLINTKILVEDNFGKEYTVDDYIIVSLRFYVLDLVYLILWLISVIVQILIRTYTFNY